MENNDNNINGNGTVNNNGNKSKTEKSAVPFSKIMLASGVGTLLVLLLFGIFKILTFIGVIAALSSNGSNANVKADSFLKIDLTKSYTERTPDEMASMFGKSSETGFVDLLRSIQAAYDDKNIKGIYLYMGSSYQLSWGKSEELRAALAQFCESGKPVLAYADGYTQPGFLVASVADSIYLNPSGMLDFCGIGAEALFFKDLLDRLDVKMTLIRPESNKFKTAGETYTSDRFSDANRQQMREYVQSIWNYAVERISEARDISTAKLNDMADNLECILAYDALNNKMVDRLCFEADITTSMRNSYKAKNVVELDEYAKNLKQTSKGKNQIAIIYAEGNVVTGDGYRPAVYSDKVTRAINEAAANDKVKAIVLRVNSPGGAVTASEIMTNAVMRAKQKKPVIVSMGDVAASAGYEISCNADYIIAEPTTITGSIGVFATIPEVGGMMKKHLGITTDTVNTNKNSTSLGAMRPMSPQAKEMMQRNVEDFYKVFVQRVATGRGLKYDFVDSIARGRVWTGHDALKLGLVDALGGIDDAVAIAAERAGIKDYRVVDFPEDDSFLKSLLESQKGGSGTIMTSTNSSTDGAHVNAQALASNLAGYQPIPIIGDGVWIKAALVNEMIEHICGERGLQARIDFFLVED